MDDFIKSKGDQDTYSGDDAISSPGDGGSFAGQQPDPTVLFEPGTVLAKRFAIKRQVARGGMGVVYEAYDQLSQKKVALKAILPQKVKNPQFRARFIQEVNTARTIRHPGVVAVYDLVEEGELLFYTMEFLEGWSLRHYMSKHGKLSLKQTVGILTRVCAALEDAHKVTIHRDISPENIMLLRDRSVKLLDFGIAKARDEVKSSQMQKTQGPIGKAEYMAPEQRKGTTDLDPRADLWSIGVTFFEMLTGELPAGYRTVTELRPDVPKSCDEVFSRTVAPAERRYANAKELRAALTACVEPKPDSPSGTVPEVPPRPVSVNPIVYPVVAIGATLIILLMGFWFLRWVNGGAQPEQQHAAASTPVPVEETTAESPPAPLQPAPQVSQPAQPPASAVSEPVPAASPREAPAVSPPGQSPTRGRRPAPEETPASSPPSPATGPAPADVKLLNFSGYWTGGPFHELYLELDHDMVKGWFRSANGPGTKVPITDGKARVDEQHRTVAEFKYGRNDTVTVAHASIVFDTDGRNATAEIVERYTTIRLGAGTYAIALVKRRGDEEYIELEDLLIVDLEGSKTAKTRTNSGVNALQISGKPGAFAELEFEIEKIQPRKIGVIFVCGFNLGDIGSRKCVVFINGQQIGGMFDASGNGISDIIEFGVYDFTQKKNRIAFQLVEQTGMNAWKNVEVWVDQLVLY